jgi:hypothetical protein
MPSAVANGSTAYCGNGGKAVLSNGQKLVRLQQWTVTMPISVSEWGDSDSNGWTNRKCGRKDATGSIVAILDDTNPVFSLVGSDFIGTFILDLSLWYATSAKTAFHFPRAVITNFSMNVNQDTKEVISYNFDFGADGQVYRPLHGSNAAVVGS